MVYKQAGSISLYLSSLFRISIYGLFFSFLSFASHSATVNQINMISKAAKDHVLKNISSPPHGEIKLEVIPIDPRLKVTDCSDGLNTSSPSKNYSSSNLTVLVDCPSDNWHMYIPVRFSILLPQLVAIRPLTKGRIISEADIKLKMVEQRAFRNHGFSEIDLVAGARLKKNLRSGDAIESNDLCVVCRDEKVTIHATYSNMTITTSGTALSDGILGDSVKVKNNQSKRIIKGQVSDIGEITVFL